MAGEQKQTTEIHHHVTIVYGAPSSSPFNLGLQKLAYLDEVTLRQDITIFGNKYAVFDKNEAMVFYAKEGVSGVVAELGGQDRAFQIDLFDERDQVAISLRRNRILFKKKKMQVFVNDELVSKVRLKKAIFSRLLHINDANDQTVFTVSGPMGLAALRKYKFEVVTESKHCVGSITKMWRGLGNELLNEREVYQIRFPLDLDLRYKAAIIGTCILIDIHFYSSYFGDIVVV